MKKKFIVAEISKTWPEDGTAIVSNAPPGYQLPIFIAKRFEDVINTQLERGYELADWRLTSSVRNPIPGGCDVMTETIIAVFRSNSKARRK